ncbi:MAG TPA: dolichyl-phosphate beta-glucosyltransferase [Terriglobales bacterium]|nr:dolichyl-phosphate beta-glucosyltransferase [Terriglobales bacterium]
MQYSIVIPAYNESRRIVPTLNRVLTYLAKQGWDAELIVVNDGSRDDTAEIVRRFAEKNPMMGLLENPGNRGKGYSVRNGMLNARGDVLLFSDADLSSPIEEAAKLLQAIANGADVAIGSRWMNAELQTERQPLYRQLFGRLFNLILRVVLGLKYKDTQCGFKAFTSRAAHAIFPLQRIERWGFDPELIFLAQKQGFKVVEVPVQWAHDEKTTLSPLRDGTRMFFEVMKIRWNAITGKYPTRRAGSGAATL